MKDAFAGSWRLDTMELWDREAIDLLGPGFIRFGSGGMGEFRFCAVLGWMDCRFGERDGQPLVEFSWAGDDDADAACGRGWAVIERDGTLQGRLFIHQGDDSAFTATRGGGTARARSRPSRQR